MHAPGYGQQQCGASVLAAHSKESAAGISLACDLQAKGYELRVVKVPDVEEPSITSAPVHVCLPAGNIVTATAGSFAGGCHRGATKPECFRRNHPLPEYLLTLSAVTDRLGVPGKKGS